MRDLPVVARFILNVILYAVYVFLAFVIFSFAFPLVMQLLGKQPLNPGLAANSDLFDKIAIFIAIFVFVMSLILRRFFYICGRDDTTQKMIVVEETESYTKPKKSEKTVRI